MPSQARRTRPVRVSVSMMSRVARLIGTASPSPMPADLADIHRGDIVVSLDGNDVVTSTSIQRLMVEDAIDRQVEMTVWRNGALVDVFVVPRELVDAS